MIYNQSIITRRFLHLNKPKSDYYIMMKKLIPCFVVAFFFVVPGAFAQQNPPPPHLPLDGGLLAFLGLGAAAGVKVLRDYRKKNEVQGD